MLPEKLDHIFGLLQELGWTYGQLLYYTAEGVELDVSNSAIMSGLFPIGAMWVRYNIFFMVKADIKPPIFSHSGTNTPTGTYSIMKSA